MKHPRLIYSHFVANRPEPISFLELWCLLGGVIVAIYVAVDSGSGFSGEPRLEMLLALVYPAVYFYIHYLARYIKWMEIVLAISILAGLTLSSYMFFFPEHPRFHLPASDVALIIFSSVALIIIATKRMRE